MELIDKINLITEDYLTRFREFEFFINPSLEDYKELKNQRINEVRFVLDNKNKNLIVWNSDFMHYNAIIFLKNKNKISAGNQYLIPGTGKIKGNKKIEIEEMNMYLHTDDQFKEVMKTNWSWADKWFVDKVNKTLSFVNVEYRSYWKLSERVACN
ncbi:MAG: hypothetical protein ACOC56_00110 [Atribacterota bacterium]